MTKKSGYTGAAAPDSNTTNRQNTLNSPTPTASLSSTPVPRTTTTAGTLPPPKHSLTREGVTVTA